MLKIIRESDPITVSQLTLCIYSPPGLGKTSLGFSAEAPVVFDFDNGAYRAANRKDTVQVDSWAAISGLTADDLKPYKTIVVDTAGRALDALTASIIAANPKMGNNGALSLQGFGQLKSQFTAWVKLLRSFGKDVVLIAHSDEKANGDDVIERLDVQGGSKNEIYKCADAMGRLSLVQGKRYLNFSPTDTAFGKNPAQLAALLVPDYAVEPAFLGKVIADIKSALNRQTDVQKKAADALVDWSSKFDEATTLEDFNGLIEKAKAAPKEIRDNVGRLLTKAAKAKGFELDKGTKQYKAATKAA